MYVLGGVRSVFKVGVGELWMFIHEMLICLQTHKINSGWEIIILHIVWIMFSLACVKVGLGVTHLLMHTSRKQ